MYVLKKSNLQVLNGMRGHMEIIRKLREMVRLQDAQTQL